MFTKRIIPCLDVNQGRVVKGVNFVDLRDAGDPVEIAKIYDREGADELVFLDITASSDARATVVDMAHGGGFSHNFACRGGQDFHQYFGHSYAGFDL